MNDNELDDLLNTWSTPEPSGSMRERARAGFAAAQPRTIPMPPRGRKRLLITLAISAALVLVIQAFPQTAKLSGIPFTVDSEFTHYSSETPAPRHVYTTSFIRNGSEVMLSRTADGQPFQNMLMQAFAGVHMLIARVHTSFDPPQSTAFASERIDTGRGRFTVDLTASGCASDNVIGRETVLNYSTVEVQRPMGEGRRLTLWMAPQLGCYPLRSKVEELQPDGTYRVAVEKRALKVTVNQ
jgi:hypothetical protein